MAHNAIPFQLVDWTTIRSTEQRGEKGASLSKSLQLPGLRIRIVEYSAGYLADHWCQKGHIVHCLKGEVISEHENGEKFFLREGMTYVVSDDLSSHRSTTRQAVKLLIVDGDFLKSK